METMRWKRPIRSENSIRKTGRSTAASITTADFPGRSIAAGQRLLVGDNVRWQDPVADRKSDRPLSDQFADAADLEEERRRVADALHPAQVAGCGQGIELAAGAERPDLYGDAALLAENRSAFDSSGRQRTWQPPGIKRTDGTGPIMLRGKCELARELVPAFFGGRGVRA